MFACFLCFFPSPRSHSHQEDELRQHGRGQQLGGGQQGAQPCQSGVPVPAYVGTLAISPPVCQSIQSVRSMLLEGFMAVMLWSRPNQSTQTKTLPRLESVQTRPRLYISRRNNIKLKNTSIFLKKQGCPDTTFHI